MVQAKIVILFNEVLNCKEIFKTIISGGQSGR